MTEQATGDEEVKWGGLPPDRRYPFPEQWGMPPLDRDERAGWILTNIERGRAARARGEEVRWLRHPRPEEVQLHLLAHVEAPHLAAARRALVLAATEATGRLLELQGKREPPAP